MALPNKTWSNPRTCVCSLKKYHCNAMQGWPCAYKLDQEKQKKLQPETHRQYLERNGPKV